MAFLGRAAELRALASAANEVRRGGQGAIVTVRGRRRVGTTSLIEHFLADAGIPSLVFQAQQGRDHRHELERFVRDVAGSTLPAAQELKRGEDPDSWKEALALLAAGAEPTIVVLDEWPWLNGSDKSVLGGLRDAWDDALAATPILLVLAGSDIGTMAGLSAPKGGLAGRVTQELRVGPLTPPEVADQLGLGAHDAIDAYLITGGLPQLVSCWPRGQARKAFLTAQLQDAQSPLVVSGERAMTADVPPQTSARAVIEAIGTGETTFTRIGEGASLGASRLSAVLKTLEDQRAIEVRIPFRADDGSKAKRYLVADPYLRFWMAFIEPSIGELERGGGRSVRDRIEAGWDLYRAAAVEPIVRASLQRLLPDDRFGEATHVGGWWTRDQRVKVDLVGSDGRGKDAPPAFIGAIAWGDRGPFGKSDEQQLRDHRALVPGATPHLPLVAVSRAGFRKGVDVDVAIGPEDLLAAWR